MLKRLKIMSFLSKSMSSIPPWHQTSRFPYFDPWMKGTTRGEEPRTLSGGKYTISAIPGVGIGAELMEHVIDVFDCIGAPTVFEWLPLEKNDDLEIQNIILSIRRNGIGIKGNIELKKPMQFAGVSSTISRNSTFRKELDLFVNVSRFKNFRSLRDRVKIKRDIDIVLMRGNHEGEFHLLEHSPMKNLVENYKVVTTYNAKRLSKYAFNYALAHKRKKITLARSMEITPLCDNLFAKETYNVALKYPTIQFEQLSETAAIQKALKNPEELDIVMCNGLTGSLFPAILSGILGGTNIGCLGQISERYGVFEPSGRIRGTRLIKKDIANPTAFLLAGASALHALKATNHYRCLMDGLEDTFKEGVMTRDIGGTATTTEFIKALVENMKSKMPTILCKYDNPQSKNQMK